MVIHKILTSITASIKRLLLTALKVILILVGRDILLYKKTQVYTQILVGREAQRRMNEFVSIASHELKTPLTSIKGNVQLMGRRLKQSAQSPSKQTGEMASIVSDLRELLDRTDQQLSRLTRIVNSMLESSRIHANTLELLYDTHELDRLLTETLQERMHIPQERIIHMHIPQGKTFLVMVDSARIKQVVLHYLSNAHKFSPLASPIEVTLTEDGKTAHIAVRDEGPGIPEEEQEKIWERFYRIPTIEVKNGSEVGLGVGLHVSRIIVEQHHGQTGVSSRPGEGSTFWFDLPLLQTDISALN